MTHTKSIIARPSTILAIIPIRMKPSDLISESTRLEELRISSAGISVNIQGQPVWIKNESDPASVQAIKSLYDVALKYSIKQTHEKTPSWYKKIRTWISNYFDRHKSHAYEEGLDQPTPKDKKPPQTSLDKVSKPIHPVLHADPSQIHMKAIYADKNGIHVSWSKSEPGNTELTEESIHPLGSELASVLNNCYSHLSRLGYTVVGLDMKPSLEIPKTKAGEVKLPPEEPSKSPTPNPIPVLTEHQTLKTIVVRPHPMREEDPHRLYISPVDNQENTLAITISERLLKSIRESTRPELKPDEQVTLLRCSPYKGSYKVIAVGEGLDEKQNALKWTEASRWNEAKFKLDKNSPDLQPQKIKKTIEPELF